MTRSDLIAELAASNRHLCQTDIELIIAVVFYRISEALAAGQRVELHGFGTFTTRRRDARPGRNPRTGAAVSVAEKTVPFFQAGKELRGRIDRPAAARTR